MSVFIYTLEKSFIAGAYVLKIRAQISLVLQGAKMYLRS